jgi:hypothetical protein
MNNLRDKFQSLYHALLEPNEDFTYEKLFQILGRYYERYQDQLASNRKEKEKLQQFYDLISSDITRTNMVPTTAAPGSASAEASSRHNPLPQPPVLLPLPPAQAPPPPPPQVPSLPSPQNSTEAAIQAATLGSDHPVVGASASFAARGASAAALAGDGVAPAGEGGAPVLCSTRSGVVYSTSTVVALSAARIRKKATAAPAKKKLPSFISRKKKRGRGQCAKEPRVARPRVPAPKRPAPDPHTRKQCMSVSYLIRRETNGISGNIEGFDGSVNAPSVACILRSLNAKGRNFLDFGCGYGWMLLAALVCGVLGAVGFELPANKLQMGIYQALKKAAQKEGLLASNHQENEFNLIDINEVFAVSIFSSPQGLPWYLCYCVLAVTRSPRKFPLRIRILERNGPTDSGINSECRRALHNNGPSRRLSRCQQLDGLHGR